MTLPTLPRTFYDEHPTLRHVRQAANARRCPPDLVLAFTLCRVAAMIPTTHTVHGSCLNYVAALVGPSGSGKSKADKCARDLLPVLPTDLDGLPIGSGEGLVDAYLQLETVDGKSTKRQVHVAGLFHVDEGEQFLAVARREKSTTMPILRNLWTGALVGTTGAKADTTRRLDAGTYRFALTVGLQPNYATQLLSDDHAGTPQRFLWVAAADPNAPDTRPAWPGSLDLPPTVTCPADLDPDILRQVDDDELKALRVGGHADPQRSHATLLTLRTAALLATLLGQPGKVDAVPWLLAQQLIEHNHAVTRHLVAAADTERRERDRQAADETVEITAYKAEQFDRRAVDRIAANIGRKVHDGMAHVPRLRDGTASRDRHLFDDALLKARDLGWVVIVDRNRLEPGPVKPPERTT